MTDAGLERLVEAISDGERIDWDSVRRHFGAGPAADCCVHLETVSKIGRLTREGDRSHKEVRESRWVSVLLGLAIVQIAFGVIGFPLYQSHSFVNALRLLTVLSFAIVGIVLRQTRNNARARDLGAVFLLIALGFSRFQYIKLVNTWFSAFSGSPVVAVLRTGLAVDAWAPYFIWPFARRFPATARFTFIDRMAVAVTTIAGAVGAVLFAINLWATVGHPGTGLAWTFALNYEEGQRYSATIFVLMLPALPILFLRARSAPADERARVGLFSLAMAAGIAPTYAEVILEALFPRYTAVLRASAGLRNLMVTAVILPLLAIPLVTSYSVVVHRLFDVTVIVRQGIRYLLAKWTLAILTLTPFGLLASYVYSRRNDSIVNVVSGRRGLILLALVALGSALLAARRFLVAALDRWFDRGGIDRATVLARSGDALRLVRTRSELVASVLEATANALNASAVVYFLDRRTSAYVPSGRGGLSLSCESALAAIMMQEPALSVLRTDSEHSIARFLPHTECLWLGETNACLLAPIRSTGVDRPAGIIAFGPRRDAIGYSAGDERFVTALASATGIAFENLRLKSEAIGEERDDEFGMLCIRCRRVTDRIDGQRSCPCGGDMEAASVPRRINGKFQVEALLGSGGMGVAYLASDIALDRFVAIKTLPSVSADAMATLAREARTMAALSHPNLATILGQESWRGTPILVCEYLSGGTLQQRLMLGPLATDEALTLGLTLLDALEYMHGQGVLHRDIKPSNIAFASDKTPKLLDFGLAGLMERAEPAVQAHVSRATSLVATRPAGTLAYLPPQAFQGEPPTVQVDLWGVAVVLFECIAGRHPFAAGADTAQNICHGRFVATIDNDPNVSKAVVRFFHTALSPAPHRQFESSSAMRDALTTTRAAISRERDGYGH